MKKLCLILFTVSLLAVAWGCGKAKESASGQPQADVQEQSYARNETFYCVGGLSQTPNNWNPFLEALVVPGVTGLIFEPLFVWEPLTDNLKPYLAESGTWASDKEYKLILRKGLQWSDGKTLTAKDVKFTFETIQKYPAIDVTNVWTSLEKIEMVDDITLTFVFKDPKYLDWPITLERTYIVPEHIWANRTEKEIIQGANENPIGSGPYLYDTYGPDRMVFKRNENWWGIKLLNMNPAPKRVVEFNLPNNNVTVGMLLKGELDYSNNFVPGVPALVGGYGIKTWFPQSPYNLQDATNFIFINVHKKPLDNVHFRKAMAYAINVQEIVDRVYEKGAQSANPFGFVGDCKAHMKYYDETLAKKIGFGYDPAKAKSLLAKAGFLDVDKDGFCENPDKSKIAMTIDVPAGWTDWEAAMRIVAEQLKAVGINVEQKSIDYDPWLQNCMNANFDMVLHNFNATPQPSITYLYDYLLLVPAEGRQQATGNFGRYDSAALFKIKEQLARTKPGDVETAKKYIAQIETKLLEDMPAIPLWNNPLFFQSTEAAWTGWPTAENPYAVPNQYPGMWERGMVKILCTIKAKTPEQTQ